MTSVGASYHSCHSDRPMVLTDQEIRGTMAHCPAVTAETQTVGRHHRGIVDRGIVDRGIVDRGIVVPGIVVPGINIRNTRIRSIAESS